MLRCYELTLNGLEDIFHCPFNLDNRLSKRIRVLQDCDHFFHLLALVCLGQPVHRIQKRVMVQLVLYKSFSVADVGIPRISNYHRTASG